jgi:type II secretory pathway predicted ATPase ExeA
MYRQRFALTAPPLPKNAQGPSFFEHGPGYRQLQRAFNRLIDEPGLGVLTGEAGVGKTAAMRNLCAALPRPDYQVLYLCDTAVSPLDLYRTLAQALGVRPSHRRAQLWSDIKTTLVHLLDERQCAPVVVLDEAQHLSERFLADLAGFLNFAFDSRDVLTLWLVGLPPLRRHLQMHHHAALAMRIAARVHLEPFTERDDFAALINHAFTAAGASDKLLADPALELLYRASHGLPRVASTVLRTALHIAHEREQPFLDETIVEAAIDEMALNTQP